MGNGGEMESTRSKGLSPGTGSLVTIFPLIPLDQVQDQEQKVTNDGVSVEH